MTVVMNWGAGIGIHHAMKYIFTHELRTCRRYQLRSVQLPAQHLPLVSLPAFAMESTPGLVWRSLLDDHNVRIQWVVGQSSLTSFRRRICHRKWTSSLSAGISRTLVGHAFPPVPSPRAATRIWGCVIVGCTRHSLKSPPWILLLFRQMHGLKGRLELT